MDALRRYRDRSSKELLDSIVEEVRQFSPHEQYDDITLIVAKCGTGHGSGGLVDQLLPA